MKTLASLEGEFVMDNRTNAGVPDEVVISQGLPPGAGRGLFEEACYTCSHCERVVVKNRQRTRPRGFCKKCNHVICDECEGRYVASGHACVPYKAAAEELRNALEKGNTQEIEKWLGILSPLNRQP